MTPDRPFRHHVLSPRTDHDAAARRRSRGATHFVRVAVGVVALAVSATSHAAGLMFSDGFESGNVNRWGTPDPYHKCAVVSVARDGSRPHSGQFMAECNWNGIVAWNDPAALSGLVLGQSAWNYTREFLVRVWVRYDADVTRTSGNKVLRLYPNDRLNSLFINAQLDQPTGPIFVSWEHVDGKDGAVSWGKGTRLGDLQWHKIEIYVKHNTPGLTDGVQRVWLDGQVVQEAVNIVSISPGHQWGPLYLMSNWSNNPGWEHGANNHVYWDDIEVYTDQGVGGAGTLSQATMSGGSAGSPGSSGSASPNPPNAVTVR